MASLRGWRALGLVSALAGSSCVEPSTRPFPPASLLGHAQSAIQYTYRGTALISARARDLADPTWLETVPNAAKPDDGQDIPIIQDRHVVALFGCPLATLGLQAGALRNLSGVVVPARSLALEDDAWSAEPSGTTRPWPADVLPPSRCWRFPEAQDVVLPVKEVGQEVKGVFLEPLVQDGWLLGLLGRPLARLRFGPPGEAPTLEDLPGPSNFVAGYSEPARGEAWVLSDEGEFRRVYQANDQLVAEPRPGLDPDLLKCFSKGMWGPTDVVSLDGGRSSEGLELLATTTCGGVYFYREETQSWTTLAAPSLANLESGFEDGVVARWIGERAWLVSGLIRGKVSYFRGATSTLGQEDFGQLSAALSIEQGPDGSFYLGTDAGTLFRREAGTYLRIADLAPGGVVAMAPLGVGWVAGVDKVDGGRQYQPDAPQGCLSESERPPARQSNKITKLRWIEDGRLVALLNHVGDKEEGHLLILHPEPSPTEACLELEP